MHTRTLKVEAIFIALIVAVVESSANADKLIAQFTRLFNVGTVIEGQTNFGCEEHKAAFITNVQHVKLNRLLEWLVCREKTKVAQYIGDASRYENTNLFNQTAWSLMDKSTSLHCVAKLYVRTKEDDERQSRKPQHHQRDELDAYSNYLGCVNAAIPDVDSINMHVITNLFFIVIVAIEKKQQMDHAQLHWSQLSEAEQQALIWAGMLTNDRHGDPVLSRVHFYQWFFRKLFTLPTHQLDMIERSDNYMELFKSLFTYDDEKVFRERCYTMLNLNQAERVLDSPHLFVEWNACKLRVSLMKTTNSNNGKKANTEAEQEQIDTFFASEWSQMSKTDLKCVATLYGETLRTYAKAEHNVTIGPNWRAIFDAYERFFRCQSLATTKHVEDFNRIIDQWLAKFVNNVAQQAKVPREQQLLAFAEKFEPIQQRLSEVVRRYGQILPETSKAYSEKL